MSSDQTGCVVTLPYGNDHGVLEKDEQAIPK
jgi:hypothetical protein